MELELSLKQTLKLSPQMLQSMEILQMSTLELNEYIQELVQENPAVELTEPAGPEDESEELWRRMQSMAELDHQNRQYVTADRDELDPLARVGTDGGLRETLLIHLTRQLERSRASTLVLRGAQFLAASLDENGYLRDGLADLAQAAGLPVSVLEAGLRLLQALDPPGVGARNLSECLALQLQRQGDEGLALAIVQTQLERLGRKQYHAIAQELGVRQEAVLAAEQKIQSLNPRPGSAFAGREEPGYLIPDLAVVETKEGLTVVYQSAYTPTLQMSGYYCNLQRQSTDPEVKQYLNDKIKQAQFAIQAVEQRRSTLLDCARAIVRRQESFFRNAGGSLLPLRLSDVAQELSIHESTVSRAIREKYLQCARGIYPLSFFFSREVGGSGEGNSAHQIKSRLTQLVAQEDKNCPLSDQKLCQLLEAEGCTISRRTVAKYRDELGLPSASGRRRRPNPKETV